jgi:hypothetical protein
MPEIFEMPTTVPASAVTPTAQYGGTQLRSFRGNLQKSLLLFKMIIEFLQHYLVTQSQWVH